MSPDQFDIHPEDWPLIEAAIRFGDRLKELRVTKDEQRAAIDRVQGALRRLPEVVWDLSGDYEIQVVEANLETWCDATFEGERPPPPTGAFRYWAVDYYRARTVDGAPEVWIEIGNGFTPYPEAMTDEFAGDEFGLDMMLRSGHERMSQADLTERHRAWLQERTDAWVAATDDLSQHFGTGLNTTVNATLWVPKWLSGEGATS